MKTFVINLDRRPDRYESFQKRLPADWPFGPAERFAAVDGQRETLPEWWTAGRGAYGCYQSHLQIIERCIADGAESVLILEDDATFVPGFAAHAQAFLANLPNDWAMAYFGGQHLKQKEHPPERINDVVYRPFNVNRTHAYALRGRATMEAVRDHLLRTDWQTGHHIDHHYGQLCESRTIPIYCPREWLCGQAAGKSNISGRQAKWRRWRGAEAIANEANPVELPIVAVVGQFRGGTSAVAGVLHKLGCSMGAAFRKPSKANPRGFFEAQALAKLCRQAYKEPWLKEQNTFADRVAALKAWAAMRRRQVGGRIFGGKHPTLCLMVPEMLEAWPDCRIIAVERAVEESEASLLSLGWGWPEEAVRTVLRRMIETRDAALATIEDQGRVLRLPYRDLIEKPELTISMLKNFCGLNNIGGVKMKPTCSQNKAAMAFIEPKLNRHGSNQ